MTNIQLFYNISTLQTFSNVSSYNETVIKLPNGYHMDDHKWTIVYNNITKNKVGIICQNNNYFNINSDKNFGYVSNNYIVYIENTELPIGTFKYIYNFTSTNNSTTLPSNNLLFPTITLGSDYYYNKKMYGTLFNTNNVTVLINLYVYDDIPKIVPTSNVVTIPISYEGNELQIFQDISGFNEIISKIPEGYHFRDIKHAHVYSMITGNIVGHIFAFNYFQNIDSSKTFGYCDDQIMIFIDTEFPIGSFGYTLNFVSPNNTTNFVKGTTRYPEITCLTGAYFGSKVTLEVVTTLSLSRYNYFRIYT
jgi:hypothetical protein